MKKIICTLLFIYSSFIFCQHHQMNSDSKLTYLKYESYKLLKKNTSNRIDSIGFKIIASDTLIMVKGFEQKGVRVRYEEKDSLFLERYKHVVYNKNNQKRVEKVKPTMKIWKDEVKIYFDKSVSKYNSKRLTEFIHHLDQEIDSLKIKVVKNKEESNYFIYSQDEQNVDNLDERIQGNDGFYLLWNDKQNIYSCSLKLNAKKSFTEAQVLTNLKVNFIRSLGYFYLDLNNLDCSSYFSLCKSDQKKFGKEDFELLKYHYSYGICKGTNLETFENNHKESKESLKKGNTEIYFIHN